MNEKKLTDEDIVKALDICYNFKGCTNECPYFNKNGRNFCIEDKALYKDLKDLINRLQAENEKLRGAKVIYETVDYCAEDLKKAQKENERLTEYNANLNGMCLEFIDKNAELQKQVDELKERANGHLLTSLYKKQADDHKRAISVQRTHWEKKVEQAVKDTAKEILQGLIEKAYVNECIDLTVNEVKAWFREDYGVEV